MSLRALIKDLKLIEEDGDCFYVKSRKGPSKAVSLPKIISLRLSLLIGLIQGDGHLKKRKPRIFYESINQEIVILVSKLLKEIFRLDFKIRERKRRKSVFYYIDPCNKGVHLYLNKICGVPIGKKSHIVRLPDNVKTIKQKVSFFIGYFLADGGKRQGRLGITSKSRMIINDFEDLFKTNNLDFSKEKWYNKRYKGWFYSIKFKTSELMKLINNAGVAEPGQTCRIPELNEILEAKLRNQLRNPVA